MSDPLDIPEFLQRKTEGQIMTTDKPKPVKPRTTAQLWSRRQKIAAEILALQTEFDAISEKLKSELA